MDQADAYAGRWFTARPLCPFWKGDRSRVRSPRPRVLGRPKIRQRGGRSMSRIQSSPSVRFARRLWPPGHTLTPTTRGRRVSRCGPALGGMGLEPERFSELVAPGSGLIGPNPPGDRCPALAFNVVHAHDPFHHRPGFPVRLQPACALGTDDLESPRRSAAPVRRASRFQLLANRASARFFTTGSAIQLVPSFFTSTVQKAAWAR